MRPIRIEGNIAYVPLTQGYEAVIDAADVPLVQDRTWFWKPSGRTSYACATVSHSDGRRTTLYLHKAITNFALTDHIDGDGLNNRKSNLRPATANQNAHNARLRADNKSGIKGVSWCRYTQRWEACIQKAGVQERIGRFDSIAEAEAAIIASRASQHGAFARNR